VRSTLDALWRQEQGQDVIEYSLLIAFIAFTSAAIYFSGFSEPVKVIWTRGGDELNLAKNVATNGAS